MGTSNHRQKNRNKERQVEREGDGEKDGEENRRPDMIKNKFVSTYRWHVFVNSWIQKDKDKKIINIHQTTYSTCFGR